MRWRGYLGLMFLFIIFGCMVSASWAQIRGGAETSAFTPGDLALYLEDLSGTPIGAQVKGWEIVKGSYEVAELLGKRWIRPLDRDTRILLPLSFPQKFSIEFTTHLFPHAGPHLKMFLYTAQDLKRERMGPDGPAQIYLIIGRGYHPDHDFVHFRVYDPAQHRYRDVITPGSYKFAPDQPHRVALQVRGGQLQLFIDGARVGTTPFQPEAPLVAMGFIFDAGSGHELPYKDRPALLNGLRIATYTTPAGQPTGGIRLFLALPARQDSLPQLLLAQSQTYNGSVALEALKQHFGWQEATLLIVKHPNPFAPGEVLIRLDKTQREGLVSYLKKALKVVRTQGGGLLIVGDGGDGHTEHERKLLASMRALAFAAWLAQQGIGNPEKLMSIVAENGGYESIFLIADNSSYESIF